MLKWKIIEDENIADIKVVVFGKSKLELLQNILLSFAQIITNLEKLKEKEEVDIEINFDNFEDLVFNFVDKIIFLKDVKFFIGKSAHFQFNKKKLLVKLKGQKINKNLPIKIDIKAITHHKFTVNKKNNYWQAILVFDI